MAAKLYLVAYNTAQFLGWTYLAFVLFTIAFQVINWLCCEKRTKLALE